MGKRKSAAASLEKLSRGLTRETPATRRTASANEAGDDGRGEGRKEADAVSQETREAPAGGSPARRPKGRPRTKPTDRMVRVSVDLPRRDHKYLRDFAYDAESDGMSVMRALLSELRDDEDLAGRVLDRLAGE